MQYDKSIEIAEQMLKIDDKDADTYKLIGQCYYEKRNIAKAIEYYTKAINSSPSDMTTRNNLSVAYLKVDDLKNALSVTLESNKIDNADQFTFYILARIYSKKGNTIEAIKWLKKAVENNIELKEEAKKAVEFDTLKKTKEFQEMIYR